jgi:O-succinylbenzoic acid--CoA ligase
LKAWLSPAGDAVDLAGDVPARAARLRACGMGFLACQVRDNRDAAAWALACFHSQTTFVPLPPELPRAALEKRLEQLPADVIFPEDLPNAIAEPVALRPKNGIWAVIFTSGTSGDPKGVALTGAALEASARAHASHNGASDWLLDLPLYSVGGLSVITRALFLETAIALASPKFSAEETKAWLASGRVKGLSVVPTMLQRLLDAGADLARAHTILLGGSATVPALLERAVKAGAPVRATYGMTEHASQIATEKKAGEGLVPLPGVEVQVIDGEVHVRSPALAAGYFRNGAFEALPLENGFFATGDLGELSNGKLFVRGRKSDVIVSGGKKIHPLAVEALLARLPGVADCAIAGVPDPEWGECAVAAVVETAVGAFHPELAKAALKETLEGWQIPKRWVTLAAIPRNTGGKILRAELRDLMLKPSRN